MWRGLSEGTATAVPSRPTTYTRESQSHEGSAWPLQCGVHALHTVFLFRLSPKVAKNPLILTINSPPRTAPTAADSAAGDQPGRTRDVGARDSSMYRSPGQLIGRASPPAGVGFSGLASRARAAGASVAQTAQERWQGQGRDAHGARDGRVGMGDLLPPQGSETRWQTRRGYLCRPGAGGDGRALSPSVGRCGEPVGGDVGLCGRGAGRVDRPGYGVRYPNGAADRVPAMRPGL